MFTQIGMILRRLAYASAVIGGIGVMATMILVAVDVSFRFFSRSVPGTTEIVSYFLMFAIGFLPIAMVERTDGMITLDAVYVMFGKRLKRASRIFAVAFSTVVYAALTWGTWIESMKQLRSGTYFDTTAYLLVVWPAYFIVPISLALATLVTLHRTIDLALGGTLEGDPDPVPDAPHGEGANPDFH